MSGGWRESYTPARRKSACAQETNPARGSRSRRPRRSRRGTLRRRDQIVSSSPSPTRASLRARRGDDASRRQNGVKSYLLYITPLTVCVQSACAHVSNASRASLAADSGMSVNKMSSYSQCPSLLFTRWTDIYEVPVHQSRRRTVSEGGT